MSMQITLLDQSTKRGYQVINFSILALALASPAMFLIFRLGSGSPAESQVLRGLTWLSVGLLAIILVASLRLAFSPKKTLVLPDQSQVKLVLNIRPEDYSQTQLNKLGFSGNLMVLPQDPESMGTEIHPKELPRLLPVAREKRWEIVMEPQPKALFSQSPKKFLKAAAGVLMLAS